MYKSSMSTFTRGRMREGLKREQERKPVEKFTFPSAFRIFPAILPAIRKSKRLFVDHTSDHTPSRRIVFCSTSSSLSPIL